MSQPARYTPHDFIRFRAFLRLLAEAGLDRRLAHSVDPSDIVQTVLLKATEAHGSLRAQSEAEVAGWLRAILANTLHTTHKTYFQEELRLGPRVSIEELSENSSLEAQDWLPDRIPAPPAQAEEEEAMLRIAVALEKLPVEHRVVVVLKHWHKWPVEAIAEQMGRTGSSVMGLYRRGIGRLGEDLKDL